MKDKKIKNQIDNKKIFLLVFRLLNDFVSILFVFNLLLFAFYIVGNYQNFLEESQLLILFVLTISSIIMTLTAFITLIFNIITICIQKKKTVKILLLFYLIFVILIGLIFIAYSIIIKKLAGGL